MTDWTTGRAPRATQVERNWTKLFGPLTFHETSVKRTVSLADTARAESEAHVKQTWVEPEPALFEPGPTCYETHPRMKRIRDEMERLESQKRQIRATIDAGMKQKFDRETFPLLTSEHRKRKRQSHEKILKLLWIEHDALTNRLNRLPNQI